jgi:lysophospholipase L1-like esterase
MLERLVALQASSASSPPDVTAPSGSPRKVSDDIDGEAVSMLIDAVRELKSVSRETFVLRDILNPAAVSEESIAAWRALAERIAGAGGAPLLDLNDGTVAPSDFGDRTHLNPLAAERFSAILAARVRPMVQQNHASR